MIPDCSHQKSFGISLIWLICGFAAALSAFIPTGLAAEHPGKLLVMNKSDRTVSVIQVPEGKTVATVPIEGITGHELAASSDGRFAYVPIFGNAGVGLPGTDGELMRVIDLRQYTTVGTVEFGKGVRPHCVVYEPRQKLVYVTAELEKAVVVIDPAALKIVGYIPTGAPESHMLAVTADGKRGYTANVGPGSLSVLDLANRKLVKVLSMSTKVQRISLSVDDKWAFTADQERPRLAMVDTAVDEVKHWIDLPGIAYGTAPTRDGKFLLVALIRDNKVGVIDLAQHKVIKELDVPAAPQELLVCPDGSRAFVSCDASAQIAELDLKDWKVARLLKVGKGADGLGWAPAP